MWEKKSSLLWGFPFSILYLLEMVGVLYGYGYRKAKWLAPKSDKFIVVCFSPKFKLCIISFCCVICEWCFGADPEVSPWNRWALAGSSCCFWCGFLRNLVFLVFFRLCRSLRSWQWISWSLVSHMSCWETHTMLSTNKASHPLPEYLLTGDKT